jgi:hypothetical protein
VASILDDLGYGLRVLRGQPAFAGLAIGTLALGIGASTAIFSVAESVLLKPFPYKDAKDIVVMQIRNPASPDLGDRPFFRTPEFVEYSAGVSAFAQVIALSPGPSVPTRFGADVITMAVGEVSGNAFSFLGIPAALGRTLTPADAAPTAAPSVVMNPLSVTTSGATRSTRTTRTIGLIDAIHSSCPCPGPGVTRSALLWLFF